MPLRSIADARVEIVIPLPLEETVTFPGCTDAEVDPLELDELDPLELDPLELEEDALPGPMPAPPPPMAEPPELASPVWGRAAAVPSVRSTATTWALARRITISRSVLLLVVPTCLRGELTGSRLAALRSFTGPIRPCGSEDPQVVPPPTAR
jgi:hypothetical protein